MIAKSVNSMVLKNQKSALVVKSSIKAGPPISVVPF